MFEVKRVSSTKVRSFGLIALLIGCMNSQAEAQSGAGSSCAPDCVAVGEWQFNLGLGLGLRQNPLHDGQDTPLLVLPEIAYYGERFFLRNFEFGFTLVETRRHQLHALVSPSHDQMYFNRWDPLNFMEFGSGAASVGGITSSAPIGAYRVDVRLTPAESSDSVVSGQPSSAPASDRLLQFDGVSGVTVNGRPISLSTGSYALEGRMGNNILVQVNEGIVTLEGLVGMDQLEVTGTEARIRSGEDAPVNFSSDPQLVINAESTTGQLPVSSRDVRRRRVAGLAGLEYLYAVSGFNLHLQALSDVTGVHGGYELRAAAIFPWQWGEQRWALTAGLNHQSRRVVNYYYGLAAGEVPQAVVYAPDAAGLTRMVRLDWQKPVSQRWSLRALVQYKQLAQEVSLSPLAAKDYSAAVFVGGVYHF